MRIALALVLSTACGAAPSAPDGGTPDAGPFTVTQPTRLATTSFQPRDILADDDAVYWIGGVMQPAQYEVHRIDLRTGADVVLASSPSLWASQLAMDDTSLYWTETDTTAVTIRTVAKAGGAPRSLASGLPYYTSVAVDAGRIFWVDANGGVRSARASDGGDVQHLDDVSGQALEIDADPARARVLFMAGGGVYEIPEAGAARTKLGDAGQGDLAIGDTKLAYTVWPAGGVVIADLDGKNPRTFFAGTHEARVAMLDDVMYWNDLGTTIGAVHRLAPGDAAPTTVATTTGLSFGIAVTPGGLFYGDGNAVLAVPR